MGIKKTIMNRKELFIKYPYIVAWGKKLGSFGYYIENQCRQAEIDKAPAKSVYYSSSDKRWITIDECHTATISEIEEYIKGNKGGIIIQ